MAVISKGTPEQAFSSAWTLAGSYCACRGLLDDRETTGFCGVACSHPDEVCAGRKIPDADAPLVTPRLGLTALDNVHLPPEYVVD